MASDNLIRENIAEEDTRSNGQVRAPEEGARTCRDADERYRTLVSRVKDGIVVIQEERFVLVNPAFCEMVGCEEPDVTGKTVTAFIAEREWMKLKQWHQRRMGGEILPNVYEAIGRNREGRELILEFNTNDMNHLGRPAILAVIRNVPERRKLEAQLIQAQKMEAIGTLAGGIAHDFNNLLMGIQGYTSLMMLDLNPAHPHYSKLKSIEEQVRNGSELTRQLLGFAREGKYEVKPIALNEVIHKTSAMFGRTKKEIVITCQFQEDLWPVEVDQGQIEQVLLNLYVNAWQAMPGGGTLFLETQNRILDDDFRESSFYVNPGAYVKISVTDTGVGMDEKTRTRIFEPFFTTKEMGRGTGLGLASTYGIIKGHGGFIQVASERGLGTTFEIYLPASMKAVEPVQCAEPLDVKGHETVMVVDDEAVIVDVMQEVLETLGYQVICAKSGREALAHYRTRQGKISLVILDMIMPELGGGETFDQLKAMDPAVKVILSSGYSLIGQAKQIMARGCNGFIQKPFRIQEVSQKIREVLDA
jgi:two-component system cell cycle sensor histidine kinase/response regulator CckA